MWLLLCLLRRGLCVRQATFLPLRLLLLRLLLLRLLLLRCRRVCSRRENSPAAVGAAGVCLCQQSMTKRTRSLISSVSVYSWVSCAKNCLRRAADRKSRSRCSSTGSSLRGHCPVWWCWPACQQQSHAVELQSASACTCRATGRELLLLLRQQRTRHCHGPYLCALALPSPALGMDPAVWPAAGVPGSLLMCRQRSAQL